MDVSPVRYPVKELPTEGALRALSQSYPEMNVAAILAATRLLGTASEMEKSLEGYLAQHGVSLSKFFVLTFLRRYMPEGLTATELAEKISVTRGNMTGLLDGLEKSGLIVRQDSSTDRRVIFIKLSQQGQKLLDEMLPEHFTRVSRIMSSLQEGELKKLTDNLEKIRQELLKLNSEGPSR